MAHIHKFVIPVEWKNFNLTWRYAGDGNAGHPTYEKTIVTKLRCVCGEEIERDSKPAPKEDK